MARLSLKNPTEFSGSSCGLRILQEDLEQVEYELDSTQQYLGSLHFRLTFCRYFTLLLPMAVAHLGGLHLFFTISWMISGVGSHWTSRN